MSKKGIKFDDDKLDWNLLPYDAIEAVVKILDFGKRKYAADDWKQLDNAEDRYFSALMRHLIAHKNGEIFDKDSGMLHLSHVATNAIFLLWFALNNEEYDFSKIRDIK